MSRIDQRGKIGIAVGSGSHQICSIGAFARAEFKALKEAGASVAFLEPEESQPERFLRHMPKGLSVLNLHIPSLHDRRKPWNVLTTVLKVKALRPRLPLVITLHELSEAPAHWRLRARLACLMADGVIVNSEPDLKIASTWGKKILKIGLGPTLWNDKLLADPNIGTLEIARQAALVRLRSRFQKSGFQLDRPWVLHAGLLTGGKGLAALKQWCDQGLNRSFPDIQFVLAGGYGPKARDQAFAKEAIQGFEAVLKDRFTFIEEPTDEEYADLLIGTDLLILPYDAGVSERRSSFLAACASGANIWTTTGALSGPMHLEDSGVFTSVLAQSTDLVDGISAALQETVTADAATRVIERRLRNLRWAKPRTWPSRIAGFLDFIAGI